MVLLRRGVMMAAVLAGLGGCTVQLAPDYDANLVDGLTKANAETLVLFVSLQKGVTPASFPQYEARYDAAIGAFSALRTQADARFVPPLSAALVAKIENALPAQASLATICAEPTDCVNPTPRILDDIIDTLADTRLEHERDGIPPVPPSMDGRCDGKGTSLTVKPGVMPFECSYLHSIEEALFVETSLKRN